MARTESRNGQRCVAVALGVAALTTGSWFLPEMPGRAIRVLDIPPSDWIGSDLEHIAVFHGADELRQALPAHGGREVPAVNWDSTDLVRVRCRAVGYKTDGDREARFGTLEHSVRLGGRTLFVYLYEPTPYLIGGEVSSVFSQMFRETWFAVPKDTRLEWGAANLALHDSGFAVGTVLLLFAFVGTVLRLRRRSPDLAANQSALRSTLPAMAPSR